jgi:hypothetical protein
LASVAALSGLTEDQKLDFIQEVGPILQPGIELKVAQLRTFLKHPPSGGKGFALALQLRKQLQAQWIPMQRKVQEMMAGAGAEELEPAITQGFVKLDLIDTRASGGDMVQAYVERLRTFLNDAGAYPLLDDVTGDLVRAGQRAGIFIVPPATERRATKVGLASGLIAELPAFPGASMDMILDARKAVETHVRRFRRAMNEFRGYLETTALEEGFREEVAEVYASEVQAAMEEIKVSLKSPSIGRTILKLALETVPAPG